MQDDEITRRDFVSITVGASIAAAAGGTEAMAQQRIAETNVEIKTPDGTCDAAFIHPAAGAHPAVLIWPDAFWPQTLHARYGEAARTGRWLFGAGAESLL